MIPTIVVIFTMILFTMIAAYEYKITLSEKQDMLLRDRDYWIEKLEILK